MDDMTASNTSNLLVPTISMAMEGSKTAVFHGTAAKCMMTPAMMREHAQPALASGLRAAEPRPKS
jgi:hypothetical protein